MIPRLVHQTWKDAEVPDRFRASPESWRARNPGWAHRLWTDDDLDRFVRDAYPDVWPLYRRYPDQIQRVDAARYMILHHHGGVYSDLDVVCVRPVEELRGHDVVLPRTAPVGVSNDLMMARPGHPLFRATVDALGASFRAWQRAWIPRHLRILQTTGSLHLTRVHRRWNGPGPIHLLDPARYDSGDPERAFVLHLPGNTWAGWDTRALSFLHRAGRRVSPADLLRRAADRGRS